MVKFLIIGTMVFITFALYACCILGGEADDRAIDADALEKEGWSLHRTIRVDKNTEEYQTKPLRQVSTIEPQRKKGKWIYGESEAGNDGYYCSKCGNFVPWKYDEYDIDFIKEFLFCNKCGADMREPEDIPMEYFESGGR